jgi:cell division protein FtsI/penicillin-binding protein 2/cell division protein FtsW (lipid II flippase)
MAVTRSWEAATPETALPGSGHPASSVVWNLLPLAVASTLVAMGVWLVYSARTREFAEATRKLDRGELLNLNTAAGPDQIRPFLLFFPEGVERQEAAEKTFAFLEKGRPLRNVGALARLRTSRPESVQGGTRPKALLRLAKWKPLVVVRTPREFDQAFRRWIAAYFASFWAVWLLWRARDFRQDPYILPAVHVLTGFGLVLMISLRDPLRDTLEFRKFVLGVIPGCALLLLPLLRVFHPRRLAAWCYTPLFAAFALFGLLLKFGTGPGGTDYKVNLGPFQPVEAIKILVVLFLAGYFARNWERLRDLRERRLIPGFLRFLPIPRFAHVLPVLCAVGTALMLFFVLKDLGPALVIFLVFLAMFSVARGRAGLAVLGLLVMVSAVTLGYRHGQPHTVVERIDMWLAPWDNDVRGGNQLAHALWAFSTGGSWGSGPGRGDPQMIPAGNTDLVLPAIGEEWGLAGVAVIFLAFGVLVWRAFHVALRAPGDFTFFASAGLASLLAFEMLLITSGVLGMLPLSGVVSPFLSSGNTAMLANFLILALLLSFAHHAREPELYRPFRRPVRGAGIVLACWALALLGAAAYYQVLRDRQYLSRDAMTFEDDGIKRAQHNPRITSIAREIPRGSIYDRNGFLLATSSWEELERHRGEYDALGISIDKACSRLDNRHYPFGSVAEHMLGYLRTSENFHATNTSLIEHDSNDHLRGYRYEELAGLVRYRHRPGHPAMLRVIERDRNLRTTLDIRLQLRADEILAKRLAAAHREKGAIVVMDAQSGDVLALVDRPQPLPPAMREAAPGKEELLDRARYGLYPPGSTFKLVTAMAALRLDLQNRNRTYSCRRLRDGRAGSVIPGWRRPIRDDVKDHAHGTLRMRRAIAISCNAYFAQLGVDAVGSQALDETARLLEIADGGLPELRKTLPFAAYGQGPLLISPFKMARVAATVAAGGLMPQGRWVLDESDQRREPPRRIVAPEAAAFLGDAMREVVTGGTARQAMSGIMLSVAGKTGTAQLDQGSPHAWFAGFAPYEGEGRRLAFAVLVEHGGYGGSVAAGVARELLEAARDLEILQTGEGQNASK